MRSFVAIIAAALAACAPMHAHEGAARPDSRELVRFPEPMRTHTLANMRDHLHTLQEINAALSRDEYEKAAALAEQRLGMTSLAMHDAAHLAAYMPAAMQAMGTGMHRAASRFAIQAQNAAATRDARPALAALGDVMAQCTACHAAYRLQ